MFTKQNASAESSHHPPDHKLQHLDQKLHPLSHNLHHVDHKLQDVIPANASKVDQKLEAFISDLPAKCNPAKMRKMKKNKKLNKKTVVVWVKKKACRRWLGGLIQAKWGWPVAFNLPVAASKLSQNWQSESGRAHPEGQGSRSEENENTLTRQGWSLADGEKDLKKEQDFGWERNPKKVGKGNNWRDGTAKQQRWNEGGGGFGQRMWQEKRGRRQERGEVGHRQQQRQGDGGGRQGTKQDWKADGTEKVGDENIWKGSWTKEQNTGDQLLDLGWGQTNGNGTVGQQ